MKKIVVVYQSLLGVYGDQGNAVVLTKRLQWRGIDAQMVMVEPGQPIPEDGLVYLLGGGEDLAQTTAVKQLRRDHGLRNAVDQGAVLFAVCAGYQLLGKSFTVGENSTVEQGLGVLDVETRRGAQRAVGEILTSWTKPDGEQHLITGFENHAGYTELGGDVRPLAEVVRGTGNGYTKTDGAIKDNVIGCYPHGPVLARNPLFADYLLELALGEPLPDLEKPLLQQTHEALRQRRIQIARTSKNLAEQTR